MIQALEERYAGSVSRQRYQSTKPLSEQGWFPQRIDQMECEGTPIYSAHAEKGVIGCMLYGDEWVSKAADMMIADYFYEPLNRAVFEALVENDSADQVLLFTKMQSNLGETYNASSVALLVNECRDLIPSPHNLENYMRPVRESWQKRSLSEAMITAQKALGEGKGYDEIASIVDEHMTSQDTSREDSDRDHTGQLKELIKHLEMCQSGEKTAMGCATGFDTLDYMTRGVQAGDLFVVAARPGFGKSTFGLNVAAHAAIHQGHGVLFFSLEMDAGKLWQRVIAAETKVDMYRMEQKQGLKREDFSRIATQTGIMQQSKLRFIDKPGMRLYQIRAACRAYCRNHDIKLVVVDYLQLVNVPGFRGKRNEDVALISTSLKALARELGVGFLVLAQINRESIKTGRRPTNADLRESGSIEQDADKIGLLHVPDPEEDLTELILDKNRNGSVGMVNLRFNKQINKFTEQDSFGD